MKVYLKPKDPNLKVLKEDGQPLDVNGEKLEPSVYWLRRLDDGDVVFVSIDNKEKNKKSQNEGKK